MLIRVGEQTVVLQVSYDKTAQCVARIQVLYRLLRQRALPDIVSLRPGLDSLAIEFREGADPGWLAEVQAEAEKLPPPEPPADILRIPVCYEDSLGRDLEKVAAACGMSPQETVELHHSAEYTVWMLGFMPGFPYLGELPERLQIPRKSKPDPFIPAGSVAVAEEYCGVYPFDSPGGWHILGRTPARLIDYARSTPWIFDYGMRVRFYPITLEEYRQELAKRKP